MSAVAVSPIQPALPPAATPRADDRFGRGAKGHDRPFASLLGDTGADKTDPTPRATSRPAAAAKSRDPSPAQKTAATRAKAVTDPDAATAAPDTSTLAATVAATDAGSAQTAVADETSSKDAAKDDGEPSAKPDADADAALPDPALLLATATTPPPTAALIAPAPSAAPPSAATDTPDTGPEALPGATAAASQRPNPSADATTKVSVGIGAPIAAPLTTAVQGPEPDPKPAPAVAQTQTATQAPALTAPPAAADPAATVVAQAVAAQTIASGAAPTQSFAARLAGTAGAGRSAGTAKSAIGATAPTPGDRVISATAAKLGDTGDAAADAAVLVPSASLTEAAQAETDDEVLATPAADTNAAGQATLQGAAPFQDTAAAAITPADLRGAPDTVASFAATLVQRLNQQSTSFQVVLNPHGLGRVDVSLKIAADGALSADIAADTPAGAAALKARSGELTAALGQAGFTLAADALRIDTQPAATGSFGAGTAFADAQAGGGNAQQGRPHAPASAWRSAEADLDLSASTDHAAHASSRARGLDIRI